MAATIPASVGVNQPLRMPPMMITGITSGSAEPRAAMTTSRERRALFHHADRTPEIAVDHQPDADQHAGDDAGEEQAADRHVAGRAVDHRHDAGRNQVGHRRRRRDQRRGERAVVAFLRHVVRDRAAQHGDVGHRRARDAGEEHAEQRHHLREPAAQVPDQRLRQPDHPGRDVGRRHQLADQQEERHREQRLGIDAVEELPDHRLHADLA